MKAIKRPSGSWRFVPPADQRLKTEEQTVFVLNPLTQGERMVVWDELRWSEVLPDGTRNIRSRANQQAYELCLAQIGAIENFPAGAPKAWPKNGSDEEKRAYLDQIDDVTILLVGSEIREHSSLEDEVKN